MITFDFASGDNVINIGLRFWDATANEWGESRDLDLDGIALAAVNDGEAIVNPLADPPTDPLASTTFGEVTVNLTRAFAQSTVESCVSFTSAYVKSRSSDSFTAALKDYIEPISIDLSVCDSVSLQNTAFASVSILSTSVYDSDSAAITVEPPGNGLAITQQGISDATLQDVSGDTTSAAGALTTESSGDPLVQSSQFDVTGEGDVTALDA